MRPGRGGLRYDSSVSTRRQQIIALLEDHEIGFDELREDLGIPVHVLKEDLSHVERSVRSSGKRLRIEPPRCMECGFVFTGRGKKHFHAPSRCPECRSEGITQPRFRVK
jgi:predicted Zn-ribbon and HTH transcriptional regulator